MSTVTFTVVWLESTKSLLSLRKTAHTAEFTCHNYKIQTT